jgi:hypothetical protein
MHSVHSVLSAIASHGLMSFETLAGNGGNKETAVECYKPAIADSTDSEPLRVFAGLVALGISIRPALRFDHSTMIDRFDEDST